MSNKGKTPLVPKLRFREFRNGNPWTEELMNEVYCFKGNNSLSRDRLNYVGGTIKNIHYGDIHTKFSTHFDITREEAPYINESDSPESPKAGNFCIEGDLIFADASEDLEDIGKAIEIIQLNGEQVVSGLHTILARQTKSKLVAGFGGYLFKSERVRSQIKRESQGAKVLGLASSRLAKIKLIFPCSAEEQKKVVECLSSLDELIAAQACKVNALKNHKKGLLQQLFPLEGETQPRLRFPGFRSAGEWEERNAGSLFVNRTTKGEDGLPIYSVTMNDGMVKRNSLDRKVDDIVDASGNKKVLKNDIAYNMMRMWQGAMGVAPEDCLVSPAYVVLAPKKDAVPQFFQYMFKRPEMLLLLTAHSRGLTKDRLRLYFDDFARMTFRCPTAKEQQRIADFLRSLDDCIATQSQALESLKIHKKGLMQQLFPSAEALEA
ncbi:type I restriction enzyme S subunit [Hydrogenophaga palleronii]|uniref:Type I restriction enzyme S subunit n=1 Tax=Hydrogenophaga palleronii TaxID=65655 RepID=A0ABU1WGP5_9BURK|nr:restriction endonuclease subunit S [Hydrogenophaga palleronii]MDR7148224.1 type I restriction enzyme S subunit [Hydrogenophaga palleronii]